ncbi:MAG TPA: hypothetical protein VGM59_09205 [Dongiaceae bacterium]
MGQPGSRLRFFACDSETSVIVFDEQNRPADNFARIFRIDIQISAAIKSAGVFDTVWENFVDPRVD